MMTKMEHQVAAKHYTKLKYLLIKMAEESNVEIMDELENMDDTLSQVMTKLILANVEEGVEI